MSAPKLPEVDRGRRLRLPFVPVGPSLGQNATHVFTRGLSSMQQIAAPEVVDGGENSLQMIPPNPGRNVVERLPYRRH